MAKKPLMLVAFGGNALIQSGQKGTAEEQFENLKLTMGQIAKLAQHYKIVITHGNGPQVGNLLLQQEACRDRPRLPLEILVAQTEGQIGYMIESSLDEALMALGVDFRPLVSLITYVVVDQADPAFKNPTKPIGPGYTAAQARRLPYPTIKTAKGYRRVVASPEPATIVERREIKRLIDMDFIVVCCGGGGIPVIRRGRAFNGVDAVIDKDLASARLAKEVGVDIFVMATDIAGVMLDFGTPQQRLLTNLSVSESLRYEKLGHFPPGSMRPKVEAARRFVKTPGNRAVITAIDAIEAAVVGKAGTEFTAD